MEIEVLKKHFEVQDEPVEIDVTDFSFAKADVAAMFIERIKKAVEKTSVKNRHVILKMKDGGEYEPEDREIVGALRDAEARDVRITRS